MLLIFLKIIFFIIIFLLILLVFVLVIPISYQIIFNTDNKKIILKIAPSYYIFLLNIIAKIDKLKNSMSNINKIIDIDGVKFNNNICMYTGDSQSLNESSEIQNQISKYKKNEINTVVTPKSLLKDSVTSDKKINIDNIKSNENIVVKLKKIYNNLYSIYNKTTDKDIKKFFLFALKNTKKILINKNTKIYTDLIIGIDDPYIMGQILSALSILYVYNGDNIKILPHFDKNIFNGNIKIIGKIYLIQIVVFVLRLLFHKGFKKLIKK